MRGYGDLADVDPRRKESCIKGLHRSTSSRGNETKIIKPTSQNKAESGSSLARHADVKAAGCQMFSRLTMPILRLTMASPPWQKLLLETSLDPLRVGPCVLRSLSKSVRVASRVGLAMSRNCLSLEIIRRQNPSDSDARIGLFWIQNRLGFTL